MFGKKKEPRPLKCFEERLPDGSYPSRRLLGLRTVPLRKIVGSVGRCREESPEKRHLNPFARQKRPSDRLKSIERALRHGVVLPPVDLYKVGDEYFILDGHHRVMAGRKIGQIDIDAIVTEFIGEARGTSVATSDRETDLAQDEGCMNRWHSEQHARCLRVERLERDAG